ncbi:hypothetical protein BRC81_16735 [Halobacteriales archaeon QS_1_68_20]|nr:MAG: hypothetical protein BRC81_16735 [Halobacteriales archaeon QS_1_68_20]
MSDDPDDAGGDALADLEAEYQTYRVLRGGEDVSARIDAVGYDDAAYLRFEVSEDRVFTVALGPDVSDLASLAALCGALDVRFTGDLDPLVGETVTLRVADDRMRRVSVAEGGLTDREVVDPPEGMWTTDATLPPDVTAAVDRLRTYDRFEGTVRPVTVRSADATDDAFSLELDLLGRPAQWTVPVPDGADMAGSTFERLVEDVGFGSVGQIVDGTLSTVPTSELGAEEAQGALGAVEDPGVTWPLFPDEESAEAALDGTAAASDSTARYAGSTASPGPTGEYVTPERIAKVEDALADGETVHYLGRGGGIEIDRGESTDVVTSFSGMERIALTDRRIVLQSSQVSGDEVYELGYDEVDGVELDVGFLNKRLSIHTAEATYHFKGANPDADEYREMATYVRERAD